MASSEGLGQRRLREDERAALLNFARLDITYGMLLAKLGDMVQLECEPNRRVFTSRFHIPEPGIAVARQDVKRALDAYRSSRLRAEELRQWAAMLLLNDAYDLDGPDNDYVAEVLNGLAMLGPHDVWLSNLEEKNILGAAK